jgi:hypothetical protein
MVEDFALELQSLGQLLHQEGGEGRDLTEDLSSKVGIVVLLIVVRLVIHARTRVEETHAEGARLQSFILN